MGFYYRQRVRLGKTVRLNLSKRGASLSSRIGPLTVNSRGRVTMRLAKGLTWRL